MPSNDEKSLQGRRRALQYAHQGAAGSPNYGNSDDPKRSDASSNSDKASNRSTAKESRNKASERASDLKYQQYDGSYVPGNFSQLADACTSGYNCGQGNGMYDGAEHSSVPASREYLDYGDANIIFCREVDMIAGNRGVGNSINTGLYGGCPDEAGIHEAFPGYSRATVEEGADADVLVFRGAHGETSDAPIRHNHNHDDGLDRLRARIDAIRIKEKDGEARLNDFLEKMANWRQRARDERVLCQEQATIERRTAEHARKEAHLQAEWMEKGRLGKQRKEEDAAVARHILRREEEDLQERVAQQTQPRSLSQHAERPASVILGDEGRVHPTREFTPTSVRDPWIHPQSDRARERAGGSQSGNPSIRKQRSGKYRFIGPKHANGPDVMHHMASQCCKCSAINATSKGQSSDSEVPLCGHCSHPLCLHCGRQAGVWVVRVKVNANGKLLSPGSQRTV